MSEELKSKFEEILNKYDFTLAILESKSLDQTYMELMQAAYNMAKADEWVSVADKTPAMIDGKDYSENVIAIVDGYTEIQVMCYCWMQTEEGMGYVWANCFGDIHGDAEFDDEYIVTKWQPLPKAPNQ